ncbi:MAG: protein kinase [Terriglobia bacterium]
MSAAPIPQLQPVVTPLDIKKGTEINKRYVFSDVLGSGGYATVWRATDKQENRNVAIKRLLHKAWPTPSREDIDRFLQEGRSTARLKGHKNIVEVYDAFEEHGEAFIVMEYIEGSSLQTIFREHIASNTWIAIDEGLEYFTQILNGLVFAHSSGIYHRDVKPSNILVSKLGVVKLVDFGLAKRMPFKMQSPLDKDVGFAHSGTPSFMSFEQARGDPLDQQTDIFSAGLVGYILLSGQHPFNHPSGTVEIVDLIRDPSYTCMDLPQKTGLPEGVRQCVMRMLSKDRSKRYQSLIEPINELTREDAQMCSNCGTANPLTDKFCGECGNDLRATKQALAPPTTGPVAKTAAELTNQGFEQTRIYDWEGAIERYEAAIAKDPKYVRAYANLGFALNKLGRYEEAIGVLTEGTKLPADSVVRHRMLDSLGFAKTNLKHFESAIQDYTNAIKLNPENPRVFLHRAEAAAQLGTPDKEDQAYSDVTQALSVDPTYLPALRLKSLLERRRFNR